MLLVRVCFWVQFRQETVFFPELSFFLFSLQRSKMFGNMCKWRVKLRNATIYPLEVQFKKKILFKCTPPYIKNYLPFISKNVSGRYRGNFPIWALKLGGVVHITSLKSLRGSYFVGCKIIYLYPRLWVGIFIKLDRVDQLVVIERKKKEEKTIPRKKLLFEPPEILKCSLSWVLIFAITDFLFLLYR